MQRYREIDREAWAKEVQSLIKVHARGKQTTFAERVGVTARTVNRWLGCKVAVSEESVRAVAEAYGLPSIELLVRLGYYTEAEAAMVRAMGTNIGQEIHQPADRDSGIDARTKQDGTVDVFQTKTGRATEDDEESIRLIMQSDAPEQVKETLVREIRAQQRRDAAERVSLAQRLLDMFRQTPSTT